MLLTGAQIPGAQSDGQWSRYLVLMPAPTCLGLQWFVRRYPSWAADGNLYTPWTDGTVNGVHSSSGGEPQQGYNSTTGHAVVVGDNPFSLQVLNVTTVVASTFP